MSCTRVYSCMTMHLGSTAYMAHAGALTSSSCSATTVSGARSDSAFSALTRRRYADYKCLVISPGTPTEPQRTASSTDTRSLIGQLIPSALCFGPLRGLTSSNKRKESDARRSKAIREIQAAQQRASAAAQASSRQVGSEKDVDGASRQARAARKARSCKKCPRDAQGERPPKPGTSRVSLPGHTCS